MPCTYVDDVSMCDNAHRVLPRYSTHRPTMFSITLTYVLAFAATVKILFLNRPYFLSERRRVLILTDRGTYCRFKFFARYLKLSLNGAGTIARWEDEMGP